MQKNKIQDLLKVREKIMDKSEVHVQESFIEMTILLFKKDLCEENQID